jgi:RNA-directed DNA polymerase
VVDLDVKGFFADLDHGLVMKAVRRHDQTPGVPLYIKRRLTAPVRRQGGSRQGRTKGSPQGAVVSPLRANLFLHHAFDNWMRRNHPDTPPERYADEVIAHARSKAAAERLPEAIRTRLARCGLELHPERTRVVYCRDSRREGRHAHTRFDFLGYTFRPRRAMGHQGKSFVSFLPGVSNKSGKAIRAATGGWQLAATRGNQSLEDLARRVNPAVSRQRCGRSWRRPARPLSPRGYPDSRGCPETASAPATSSTAYRTRALNRSRPL